MEEISVIGIDLAKRVFQLCATTGSGAIALGEAAVAGGVHQVSRGRGAAIAERHPGLKLIVDHMGVARASRDESAYRFQPELLALAKYPNVAVKATGQSGYAEDEYPFRSLHRHLHRCFDAFGPERMFWGTDITRMQCSWRQCVSLFTEELPWSKAAISSWSWAKPPAIGWVGPSLPRPKAGVPSRSSQTGAPKDPEKRGFG
jgi:Amidohydrolase